MKNVFLLFLIFVIQNCGAQCISRDSLIRIVARVITQQECRKIPTTRKDCVLEKDYLQSFYINDILNNQPISESESYGIYVFGRFGDDIVSVGTLLYDCTGYEFLPRIFNYESLGLLLNFFGRNNLSAEESIKYLTAIYRFEKEENNIGFQLEN